MFIAMNRFKVIKEERKAFEDLWVTRLLAAVEAGLNDGR